MANDSLTKKLLAISPKIEVLVRRTYWKNIKLFSSILQKFVQPKKDVKASLAGIDFKKIIGQLSDWGVNKGDLVVVHSAYRALKGTGMSPNQILDELIRLIGPTGTLAMPAMPIFRNAPNRENYLTEELSKIVFSYDRQKSRTKTGVLPSTLNKYPGAVRSLHPINTMVAYGRLANEIMRDNLKDEFSLPCGKDSSWYKCTLNNAWVVGLGTDLTHSLTMIHVAEDVLDEKWPVKNWYRKKKFRIIDDKQSFEITLRERHPKWGTLCFAERTLCEDLIKKGIMRTAQIDGVILEIMRAKDLFAFLMSKNCNGYPYFGLKV